MSLFFQPQCQQKNGLGMNASKKAKRSGDGLEWHWLKPTKKGSCFSEQCCGTRWTTFIGTGIMSAVSRAISQSVNYPSECRGKTKIQVCFFLRVLTVRDLRATGGAGVPFGEGPGIVRLVWNSIIFIASRHAITASVTRNTSKIMVVSHHALSCRIWRNTPTMWPIRIATHEFTAMLNAFQRHPIHSWMGFDNTSYLKVSAA